MTLAVGDVIGPYRIVDQLGQGGMATVYRAYHANLDRYVAMKVLHPAFTEDPGFLERFKREAQIVARLEHPNIVPIYDYADFDGQPYLIMKHIEGETLKVRLKQNPLTLPEMLRTLETVAAALTYAHEHGILHRDIKPSNIILDRHNTPYIADFGLARIAQAGESTLSQDAMLGTPQYISPEQAKGVRDLGPSTDIYSLAVVVYEIMVGRVPFNADTPYAIIHDHIYKPLPLPCQVNPEVPAEVEQVLIRALSKEPETRYPSAVAMVEALQAAVKAANLTELSVTNLRPQAVVSSNAATLPPDVIAPTPTPTPAYVMVPSPIPTPTDLRRSKEAYRRRANLWILGGVGGLLLTCLASLFIIVNAVSDPELRPWEMDNKVSAEQNTPQPSGPPADGFAMMEPLLSAGGLGDMTVQEAQTMVESDPQNPTGYFYLAAAQANAGDQNAALVSLSDAIAELDLPSDVLVTAAAQVQAKGRTEIAIWLYMEALSKEDVPAEARNTAGEALYNLIQTDPILTRTVVAKYIEERPQTALAYTIYALTLLHSERDFLIRLANVGLESALELDDSLAEIYFARGLYYAAMNQPAKALEDWQYAASLPEAPAWVIREAQALEQSITS
jgi:serine/threonine protein kinase